MNPKLAAFLSSRQGLDRVTNRSNEDVLAANGWARTVGGANPYLSLFARNRALREAVDRDVANMDIHEFASARGCTYLLPKEHFQLGIKCGQGFNADSAIRTAKNKLGASDEMIEGLKAKILQILAKGPLEPSAMKEPLGEHYIHYGEQGKKVGQTTNVSLGLLSLQAEGKIRRISTNGRLDGQSYAYAVFENPPTVDDRYPREEAFRDLARLYWQWCGFASLAHFQWFSGLGAGAAKAAVEGLNLVPVEKTSLLGSAETLELFYEFQLIDDEFRLVSGLDSLFLLRRDLTLHLSDEAKQVSVLSGGKMASLGTMGDLSVNAIVRQGQIVGLWEYDFEASEIVWVSFVGKQAQLLSEIEQVQAFIREDLGDARSFSLDSPKSRRESLAVLRSLAT